MSDAYQAVYDATRSRLSNCDVGAAIERATMGTLDFSHVRALIQEQVSIVGNELARPFVIMRPRLSAEGEQWCALLGDDLQTGVCGFGETPEKAAAAFDQAWFHAKAGAQTGSRK